MDPSSIIVLVSTKILHSLRDGIFLVIQIHYWMRLSNAHVLAKLKLRGEALFDIDATWPRGL